VERPPPPLAQRVPELLLPAVRTSHVPGGTSSPGHSDWNLWSRVLRSADYDRKMTPDQRELLERFADAVRSSPHNLVSSAAREVLWERHVLESVGLSRLLPSPGSAATLLDVGSGGGFPGLVIAIMRPDLAVTLLDSRQKKAGFLRETAHGLGLHSVVLQGRAEEFAQDEVHRSRYDLVTARAVAPMKQLLAWTLPFLAPGGLLYAVKGVRWREELEEAEAALQRHRARVVFTPDDPNPTVPGAPRTVIVTRDPASGSA
jgi:16S rRNA (guanine527-N7)-methyltransferase